MGKARFWEQQSFYGVDLSPLSKDAKDEMFGNVKGLNGSLLSSWLVSVAHVI